MPIVPTPDYLRHESLRGVFVGGCVAHGDGARFMAKAHAHTSGPHTGWICVLSAKRLQCAPLMLHELAHIITGDGHTDRWRTALLAIGGTLDACPGRSARVSQARSAAARPTPTTPWARASYRVPL